MTTQDTLLRMADDMVALSRRVRDLETRPVQRTWVELADQTLTVAAPTIDFVGISQLYRHLHVLAMLRSAVAATTDAVALRMNGDVAANYNWVYANVRLSAGVATWLAAEGIAATRIELGLGAGNTAPASVFSPIELNLPDYRSTVHRKAVRAQAGHVVTLAAANIYGDLAHGIWTTVGVAVNRLTFLLASGSNFMVGSRITVYGMG
jgi:hypothetical protein